MKRFAAKYIVRYYRKNVKTPSLQDQIKTADQTALVPFQTAFQVIVDATEKAWKFDSTVADRFQQEATQHIPDYKRVIDMCVDIANATIRPELKDTAPIIDFGSALGFTVDKFINNGYNNTWGLDNSPDMIAKSLHPDRIILSDKLPDQQYNMILVNWTLHFIVDKVPYLQDFYNKLSKGGILILSDKTVQSQIVKDMYYQFKLDNGVDPIYIKEKEKSLVRIMNSMPADWYVDQLRNVGFPRIEIINSRYGFVTFMCRKV
jgi:SAM-dependent methyltransferase